MFDCDALTSVLNLADKANGYIFKGSDERNVFQLLSSAMSSTSSSSHYRYTDAEPRRHNQQTTDEAKNILFNQVLEDSD